MKTKKEVQFIHRAFTGQLDFFNGQELKKFDILITIPKGTSVTNKTAMGIDKTYHFVDDFSAFKGQFGLIHDLIHRGANVPIEFITGFDSD